MKDFLREGTKWLLKILKFKKNLAWFGNSWLCWSILHWYKGILEAEYFIKKCLFGSWFCRLYKKHGMGVCFSGVLRKISVMVKGKVGAGASHGERGSKRDRRRWLALYSNQSSCELIVWELTHYLREGTKPFMNSARRTQTSLTKSRL